MVSKPSPSFLAALLIFLCCCLPEHHSFVPLPPRLAGTSSRRAQDTCRAARVAALQSSEKDTDIVERFVSFVFGKQALADQKPLGLQRATVEKFPDRFPATKDRWADAVPGDSADVKLLRPLLAQTCLEQRKLKCVFDAKRNGWQAKAFHKCVDKLGPGIVLAVTTGGVVCGGYNSKGWVGEAELRPGLSNFLFTWLDGDTSKRPIKLRKIGGAGIGVQDRPTTGPYFGADSFCVDLEGGKSASSKLGSYYERLPNGKNSLFGASGVAELRELKVFTGVYAKGEPIPFDDVIVLSLT